MTYDIYLREDNGVRLIAKASAEMWPFPNQGETWSIAVDGVECLCEIVDVDNPRVGLDERTLLSQDVFVQRIGNSN